MPRTSFNVLFVCLGNICRSPAGENIFRYQVKKAGLENLIHIDSAGTHDYHPGKSPDKRMTKTLNNRSIKSEGSGRQFKSVDLQKFDLILTEGIVFVSDKLDITDKLVAQLKKDK